MKNIYKSLALFQQEVKTIHQDTKGYGYTYTNLSTILETINPLLAKHGLGFTQLVNGTGVLTILFHVESGETIQSETDIPQGVTLKGMNEFQVLGSAITYIRRYSLSSMLGLVTDKDADAAGEQSTPPAAPLDIPRLNNRLNACTTMAALQSAYMAFTPAEQAATAATKDAMKLKLS
jgi:hypothetical protein